ncbi:hypothetical protein C8R46DRAFT_270123 [Mycena filopes]|nr:hypothetical protein C8R46DRAFT_270123 [Mycena filopes]
MWIELVAAMSAVSTRGVLSVLMRNPCALVYSRRPILTKCPASTEGTSCWSERRLPTLWSLRGAGDESEEGGGDEHGVTTWRCSRCHHRVALTSRPTRVVDTVPIPPDAIVIRPREFIPALLVRNETSFHKIWILIMCSAVALPPSSPERPTISG